jgi:DNA primase
LDLFVNSGLGVKVITLPSGDDPDTFVRREGPGAFARLEELAPSLLDFALDHSMKQAEAGSLESRVRSVDEVLRILQKSEHPIEREERIRVVAERLGVNQSRLIERYPALLIQRKTHVAAPRDQTKQGSSSCNFKGLAEERDLVLLLLHGKLSSADVRRLKPELFSVAACRKLVLLALAHLDRDGRIGVRPLLDAAVDDPECGALATELSLRDDHYDDVPAHIKACFECLDRKRAEQELRDRIAQLKAAEREGRVEDAHALNVQVNELRMKKAGMPAPGVVSLVKE